MIQARGEPRLTEKALAESVVVGVTRSEELEGNVPVEAAVVRAVHLSHAAAADQLLDPVAADLDYHSQASTNTLMSGHTATATRSSSITAVSAPTMTC